MSLNLHYEPCSGDQCHPQLAGSSLPCAHGQLAGVWQGSGLNSAPPNACLFPFLSRMAGHTHQLPTDFG